MKVILLKDIPGTGRKGEIRDVAEGYARNFLLKKNWAKPATSAVMAQLDAEAKKKARVAEQELKEQQKAATRLDGSEIQIAGKVSDKGTLYAAITVNKIAQEVKKQFGLSLLPKHIKLKQAIKEIGEFQVPVVFDHGLEAELRVVVSEQ